MSRQAFVYMLSFGFSSLAAILYSFWASSLSISVIGVLFASVVYLSLLSTTVLDIEAKIAKFSAFVVTYQRQKSLVILELEDRLHRPRVALIPNRLELVRTVGQSLRESIGKSDSPAIFVGAVSLQTPDEGLEISSDYLTYEDEDEQSPYQIYQGALEEAASRHTAIRRFVKLPEIGDVENRSRSWANDYLKWLSNQVGQISRNENFFLIDSPRSPRWGAAGARIMVGENIFDITHKSGIVIHVRDPRIAALQAEKVVKSALAGDPKHVNVFCKDKKRGAAIFRGAKIFDDEQFAKRVEELKNRVEEVFH